ncbi:MAG: N-acetylneuraminate synthase family protein [Bosea sp.]|nr:N-acetylneuraminate synthase family protein [Bosea sp. (in: a-proteobacteria)]
MMIERNVMRFVVFAEDSILSALTKISANKSGFVLSVSEQGLLLGVVTDGDIRRWLAGTPEIDLSLPVGDIANPNFVSARDDTPVATINEMFSDRIRSVPLVDEYGRVVGIAFPKMETFSVGGRLIGPGHPSFVIAEIGNNHNGDMDLAHRLIDLAAEAGADCAKFQMRDMSSLYQGTGAPEDASKDLGAQYTLDLLARFNLSKENLYILFDYVRSKGMEPLCTPWDLSSLKALEEYGISGYKLASADLTNHELLLALAETGKPLFCSTGMATEAEIKESVALLKANGASFCLLHCNSTYPAPYKDINLLYMDRLAVLGDCPVGYSGHERGWAVPVAAVARGACVIEKHFTVDRSMEGNDHKVSLLPEEFTEMVVAIRAVEEAMGTAKERELTQGELINREVLAKSLHAAVDIEQGQLITDDMLVVKSPGQGLQPNRRGEVVGQPARRKITAGSPIFAADVVESGVAARPFHFPRPWGIPVRWHDRAAMLAATNLDLLEYHLSYKDMEANLGDWFKGVDDVSFVVHAPELFAGDHILDLAAEDEEYRTHSIAELQRVIDLTRTLRQWHRPGQPPLIITNMGGFSTSRALPAAARKALYDRIKDSLSRLDREGVEIIPQTMPPFPWHFGGQSYHNLFMDPDEIVAFCKEMGMRICFDVSHSQLACNNFGWSMKEFCEKVGPYTAHLHIVDAKGVDGEGLQIGDGTMDFAVIADVLNRACPDASFVPEIWQGHKDSGAGFWFALDKLERWFGGSRGKARLSEVRYG